MAFFSNRTVNYLNLHLALVNLLDQSFFVFSPLYLYQRGFSIQAILLLNVLMMTLRMPMRLLSFPVMRRFGLKTGVMIGAAGYGLSFPALSQVQGLDGWLVVYLLLYSVFNSMHWFCFHAYYSLAGEHEKRGKQVAVGQALTAGLSALAPILSVFLILHGGFSSYFALAFVLIAGMLFALSRCRNIPVAPLHWREGRRMIFTLGAKMHVVTAAAFYPSAICWLFTVYLYVGKLMSLGEIIAFGVVAQMAYQMLLGALVDRGRGRLIVNISQGINALVMLGRAFVPLSVPRILGLEATMAVAAVHTQAVLPTVMYNAGKRSEHTVWFWLFAEMGWDIGTIIGAGGSALLLWLGVELRHVIVLALLFIPVLWWLMYDYFARQSYDRAGE